MKHVDKLTLALVDDEPHIVNLLAFYLNKFDFVEVQQTFTDAELARDWLLQNRVDLLITDIDMPALDGIDLIQSLIEPPRVIYCTSHEKFAVNAFVTHPIDYLMKPVAYDRLKQALYWALEAITGIEQVAVKVLRPYLFVRDVKEKKEVKVDIEDIQYVQVTGNTCSIATLKGAVETRKTLKEFKRKLGEDDFMMVERSFLVNKWLIREVQEGKIILDGVSNHILIGPEYAKAVRDFVKKNLW